MPIESQGSTLQFGMIDDARLFEHSGPAMALFKWSSTMKQFLLYVVFLNVLVIPWGLAGDRTVGSVAVGLGWLLVKMIGLRFVMVVIESSFAKLRLFRIPDFMGAGFVLSVLAILVFYLVRGFRRGRSKDAHGPDLTARPEARRTPAAHRRRRPRRLGRARVAHRRGPPAARRPGRGASPWS